jgi:hypothetical protein
MLWGWSASTGREGVSASARGQIARAAPQRGRKPLPSKTTAKAPTAVPAARSAQRRKTPP